MPTRKQVVTEKRWALWTKASGVFFLAYRGETRDDVRSLFPNGNLVRVTLTYEVEVTP